MSSMKIVFHAPGSSQQSWVDALQTALPDATVWLWSEDAPGPQADYAVVWSPPPALFDTQPSLKALFNIGAGVDGILRLDNLPRDLPVIRLDDAGMSVQMAEFVCQAVIRHARRLDDYETGSAAGGWHDYLAIDRAAYPVGVMGLGAIGARVAQSIAAFDYPVLGWSRSRKALPGVTCMAGAAELHAFLARVRILVCLLPLTPDTTDILNRDTLGRLLPDAYLINVARGKHLVEDDLLPLLESGKLAGAALDVFREEPLPPGHPFWRHPKIRITPHISARTLRTDSVAQIAQKIRNLEQGLPVAGLVETQRGY